MASSQRSQVTVTTNDGVNIHVDRQVAERSVLIKNLLEDVPETGESIQLPNVNEAIMRKVIKWCEHHRNDLAEPEEDDSHMPKTSTDIDEWDRKFMQVDQETLFQIILVGPRTLTLVLLLLTLISRWRTTSTSRRCSTLATRRLRT